MIRLSLGSIFISLFVIFLASPHADEQPSRIVSLGKTVDGAFFAAFLMLLSGSTLYMFGEFYRFVVVTNAKKMGKIWMCRVNLEDVWSPYW